MSCPDRLTLFVGLEEDDPTIHAHLAECEGCRAIADGERALGDALGRLRDPAPPAELLRSVMSRVEDAAALARRARRQVVAILAGLTAALTAGLAVLGPAWLIGSATHSAHVLSTVRTALAALGRSLAPQLSAMALPLVTAQIIALLTFALVLNRLVAARVRS